MPPWRRETYPAAECVAMPCPESPSPCQSKDSVASASCKGMPQPAEPWVSPARRNGPSATMPRTERIRLRASVPTTALKHSLPDRNERRRDARCLILPRNGTEVLTHIRPSQTLPRSTLRNRSVTCSGVPNPAQPQMCRSLATERTAPQTDHARDYKTLPIPSMPCHDMCGGADATAHLRTVQERILPKRT